MWNLWYPHRIAYFPFLTCAVSRDLFAVLQSESFEMFARSADGFLLPLLERYCWYLGMGLTSLGPGRKSLVPRKAKSLYPFRLPCRTCNQQRNSLKDLAGGKTSNVKAVYAKKATRDPCGPNAIWGAFIVFPNT